MPFSLVVDRPVDWTITALADFVRSSPDFFFDQEFASEDRVLNILFEGMSFTLSCHPVPDAYSVYRPIFLSTAVGRAQSAVSIKFGPNLEGGVRVPALASGYLQFIAKIAAVLDAFAVAANHAYLVTDRSYFIDTVSAYANGGAFPVLATVAFDVADDGVTTVTRGLDVFAGQEIAFSGGRMPKSEIMRRMVRLVHDVCANGPILDRQVVDDLEAGSALILEASDDGRLLQVTIRFGVDSNMG